MSYPRAYREVMARLAALDAEVAANRDEAHQWYAERCAAARTAVTEAEGRVAAAEAEVAAAERALDEVHAHAERLWIDYVHHVGPATAERFGRTLPDPAVPRQRAGGEPAGADSPDDYLHVVETALRQPPPVRPFTGRTQALFVVFGLLGGALAYAASEALRWAARTAGGDLAVGLPVLALVVMLLGPLAGFVPTRIVADRRRVPLDVATVGRVVVAALATAGLLFVVLR